MLLRVPNNEGAIVAGEFVKELQTWTAIALQLQPCFRRTVLHRIVAEVKSSNPCRRGKLAHLLLLFAMMLSVAPRVIETLLMSCE